MLDFFRSALSTAIQFKFRFTNWILSKLNFQFRFYLDIHNNALLLKSKIVSRGLNNRIYIGVRSTIRNLTIEINGNNNVIYLGKKVKMYESGRILIEGSNCSLEIGDNTTLGSGEFLLGESNTKILIGRDCMLSRNLSFNTSDFHSIIDLKTNKRVNFPSDILISDKVWIGNGAYLNKGVVIGSNCIVAANSVLTKGKYPENTIIGGVPAKVLRSEVYWSRDKL